MEASATISNAADRRVDDGQADSLTGCDDASTENGAPGASVREMTNAVRTVEPVQGPSFLAPPGSSPDKKKRGRKTGGARKREAMAKYDFQTP